MPHVRSVLRKAFDLGDEHGSMHACISLYALSLQCEVARCHMIAKGSNLLCVTPCCKLTLRGGQSQLRGVSLVGLASNRRFKHNLEQQTVLMSVCIQKRQTLS